MDRRALLRGLAALGTGAGLAGCTGAGGEVPETAPPPPTAVREAARRQADPADGTVVGRGGSGDSGVEISDPVRDAESANAVALLGQDSFPDSGENLVVTITVRNEGTGRTMALVRVTVRADGREVPVEAFVDLAPGETTTVRFTPDVTYDAYSGHEPRILSETPATPLPSATPSSTPGPGASLTEDDAAGADATPDGTDGG